MHQQLADSTFMVICGDSTGSGFLFKRDDIVVTNHHVIKGGLQNGGEIFIASEKSIKRNIGFPAKVVNYSEEHDFAVLELIHGPMPECQTPLKTSSDTSVFRGRKILFAGFPHGITDLLVHEAIVSGPLEQHAFYIDGMINGGNSGGPIIDATSGELVGIVTQRRFIGEDKASALVQQSNQITKNLMPNSVGSAILLGVDIGSLVSNVAAATSLLPEIIALNANSGIGIGFKIDFVDRVVQGS